MSPKSSVALKRPLFAACITVLAIAAGGCSSGVNHRGYVADQRIVDSIQPGVDNKASIRGAMGTPSSASSFDDSIWYYISRRTKNRNFSRDEAIQQLVLRVEFDQAGVVTGVKRYDLADARDINPRGDETPTRGREVNFFQQVFANIGRFSGAGGPNTRGPGGPGGPGPGPGP